MADAFMPSGATVNIAVAAATANVALGTAASGGTTAVRVMNNGTATVWIQFGTSAVTAALATGMPVGPGQTHVFTCPSFGSAPYAAAIAAGATGTVYFTPGTGGN